MIFRQVVPSLPLLKVVLNVLFSLKVFLLRFDPIEESGVELGGIYVEISKHKYSGSPLSQEDVQGTTRTDEHHNTWVRQRHQETLCRT